MAQARTTSRSRGQALLLAVVGLVAGACTNVPLPPIEAVPAGRFSHEDLDTFQARHVDAEGRVNYPAAVSDRDDLERYVASIARVSPDSSPERFPTEQERLAYWINAYNAWVLTLVLEHDPVGSVQEIQTPSSGLVAPVLPDGAGFFFWHRIALGGKRMSLYTLENRIVRGRFDEPRIHFALNCASIGCPRLPQRAFDPDALEAQLAHETDRFLAETRNVEIAHAAGQIRLSSIFDWYAGDFTGWMERHVPKEPATLRGWIAHHSTDALRAQLDACDACAERFVPYDWGLNAQGH